MALPQLPAYVVHKLGQQRVIRELHSTSEYAKRAVLSGRLSSCILSLLCQEKSPHSPVKRNAIFCFIPSPLERSPSDSPLHSVQGPLTRGGEILVSCSLCSHLSMYRLPQPLLRLITLRPLVATSACRCIFRSWFSARRWFAEYFPPLHFTPYAAATTAIAHRLSLPRQSPTGRWYIAYKKLAHTALAAVAPPLSAPAHLPLCPVPPVSAIYPATPSVSDKRYHLASLPAQRHYRADRWYQHLCSSG